MASSNAKMLRLLSCVFFKHAQKYVHTLIARLTLRACPSHRVKIQASIVVVETAADCNNKSAHQWVSARSACQIALNRAQESR